MNPLTEDRTIIAKRPKVYSASRYPLKKEINMIAKLSIFNIAVLTHKNLLIFLPADLCQQNEKFFLP